MNYFIGIDIGTSATKTIIIDQNGNIAASDTCEYPLYQPQNGWAEQDPEDWRKAVFTTLTNVVKKSGVNADAVKGIGLSGQMHGLVMLDEHGKPLGRSIIWCDQRSGRQVEEMKSLMPLSEWMRITANPPIAAWTAAKILWVREHQPKLLGQCCKILLPKDYVRYCLTGVFATDVSDASGLQLLDVKNRCWSDEVLNVLHIDKELLPRVYESAEVTGYLLPEVAKQCGLSEDTAVAAGGSDNACAGVGTGVVQEGEAFTTIGTSSVVYSHLDSYKEIPDGSLHICCSAVPGGWHTMGGPQAAGLSLEWFIRQFCQDLTGAAAEQGKSVYNLINEGIKDIPAGSNKLIYLPFLMGERTPHMDPDCRGAFIGLSAIHTKMDCIRAVMEGVVYSLADCNNILKELGVSIESMRVCGGGSKSPVWRQIMADLYECDIRTLRQEEGPAFGAAILAGVAAGCFDSVQSACHKLIQEDKITTLRPEFAVDYKKYHQLYDQIYTDLRHNFKLLASI
ncbi:MAG: xylulokinase [Lachnospiraceae bacterium]